MIFDQEKIIKTGKTYKFFTQPLGPNNSYRGKYVSLNYKINSFKTKDSLWDKQNKVFLYLEDSLGYAVLKTVSKVKLDLPNDYVIANVNWYNKQKNKLSFDLPFQRYYMEESKANPAENLVA